jgi:hypothetical protein
MAFLSDYQYNFKKTEEVFVQPNYSYLVPLSNNMRQNFGPVLAVSFGMYWLVTDKQPIN